MVNERIALNRLEVDVLENDILVRRHLERYSIIRQHVWGTVLDAACGMGYGTYLMAKNPDVKLCIGIDHHEESIKVARSVFGSLGNLKFIHDTIANWAPDRVDCLVSLETIEHLKDPRDIADLAKRSAALEAIITIPLKKTTHYNPYHQWDLTQDDILAIFGPDWPLWNSFTFTYDTLFLHLIRFKRDRMRGTSYRGRV
jgi:SAM-dependent methyltransferase